MSKYLDETGLAYFWGCILDRLHPVGSIYISVDSTDPGTMFGGQWQRIQDTFLLAAGTTYAADDGTHTTATGGAATHVHATKGHRLSAAESGVPAHSHQILNSAIMYNSSATGRMATSGSGTRISANTDLGYSTYNNTAAAASSAHDHGDTEDGSSMPPYLAVYVWKRIS